MKRPLLLASGLLVLALAWLGTPRAVAPGPFSAHMIVHMAVVALAAPLLAAGAAGGPLDPARAAPRLFAPIPASIVELVFVWGWHAPLLHEAARLQPAAFAAEQATFLGAGLLVWLAAFGGDRRGGDRAAAGVVGLLFTSTHMTLLGALFAVAPRPLYAHAQHGVSLGAALADQHAGGVIMLLAGGVSYMAGALYLMARLLRAPALGAGARP